MPNLRTYLAHNLARKVDLARQERLRGNKSAFFQQMAEVASVRSVWQTSLSLVSKHHRDLKSLIGLEDGQERVMYRGWVEIRHRKVGTKVYEIIDDIDSVAVLLVHHDARDTALYMVKVRRPALLGKVPLEKGQPVPLVWEPASGLMDKRGESPVQAAIREVREETGFDLSEEQLDLIGSYFTYPGLSNERLHLYVAHYWSDERPVPTATVKDQEVREGRWMDVEEFLKLTVVDSKLLASQLWVQQFEQRIHI